MKNKYTLGVFALALVAVLSVGFVAASPFGQGFMNKDLTDQERAEFQEQKQAMQTAIANEDYETWKSLMQERIVEMQSQLTEENFNTLVQKHESMSEFRDAMQEARESGDFSRMQEIKQEFGFEGKPCMQKSRGFHKGLAE
jgi:hypothetical protein